MSGRLTYVGQGTGPLFMWHVYCDHPRCAGRRVASRNTAAGAEESAVEHERSHAS